MSAHTNHFIVYGTHHDGRREGHAECASLDEAMTHLRELISNELADTGGLIFASYGLELERCHALALRPGSSRAIEMSIPGRQPWHRAAEINSDPELSRIRREAMKSAAEANAARRWNARQARTRRAGGRG